MDTSDIILIIVVPLAYVAFRVITVKKYNKSLADLNIDKFNKASCFKEYLPILIGMTILSLVALILGIINNDKNYLMGGGMMLVMSLCEIYATYKTAFFYYNDERCIIENKDKSMKVVPYKNISCVAEKSKWPFAKRHIQLYTKEIKSVSQTAGAIIEQMVNKYLEEKKEKKEKK